MKRTGKASLAAARWCIFRLKEWANNVFTLYFYFLNCPSPVLPLYQLGQILKQEECSLRQKNNNFTCTFHFFLYRNFLDYIWFVWSCWGGVGYAEGLWKEACSSSTSTKAVNKMHKRNRSSDYFFFLTGCSIFYFYFFLPLFNGM